MPHTFKAQPSPSKDTFTPEIHTHRRMAVSLMLARTLRSEDGPTVTESYRTLPKYHHISPRGHQTLPNLEYLLLHLLIPRSDQSDNAPSRHIAKLLPLSAKLDDTLLFSKNNKNLSIIHLLFFRAKLAWRNLTSTSYCSHLIVLRTEHMGQTNDRVLPMDSEGYIRWSPRLGEPQRSLIVVNYSNLSLYTRSLIYLHIVPLYNHYRPPTSLITSLHATSTDT